MKADYPIVTKTCINFFLLAGLLAGCASLPKSGAPPADSQQSALKTYYAALEEIDTGNFQRALELLNQAIQRNPGYVQFYFVKGRVFEILQQPDSAAAVYEKSLQYRSHFPEAWIRLARIYYRAQNYKKAAVFFQKSVSAFPDSLQLLISLSECLYNLGEYHLARDFLLDYAKKTGPLAPAYFKWKGLTDFRLKMYQSAEDNLTRFVANTKVDFEALKTLGIVKFQLGKYEEAISFLNKAMQSGSPDPEIYLYRAKYFEIRNKPEIAREQLKIAVQLDSSNADAQFDLAVLDFREGRIEKSEAGLQNILRFAPDYWQAYKYLGLIAEERGESQKAIAYYQRYLDNVLTADPMISSRLEKLKSESAK